MQQVGRTDFKVDIVAPNGTRVRFSASAPERDLLAVETRKDLGEAVGSFSLHFAPTTDETGRRWDQRIPRRSLVFIDMERAGTPGLPDVHPTVMVGLTDDHGAFEDWREAAPRRLVQVSGRELSCVILDAKLWFHPALARDPALGTLTFESAAMGVQTLALTYNPNLPRAGDSPMNILKLLLDYYLLVGGAAASIPTGTPGLQQPVMQLDLPGVTLPDLLWVNREQWNTFEPDVQVPIVHGTTELGSLWNYLRTFVDQAFQEFFTRIEDGVCKIHFRGKPFQHEPIESGTRFKSTAAEPTLRTLMLDPNWIMTSTMQTQTANVYNVFLAVPLGITQYYDDPHFKYHVVPYIIKEPAHPSFVGRYGLRVMEHASPYLSPLPPLGPLGTGAIPLATAPPGPNEALYAPMANRIAAELGLPKELRPYFVANIKVESNFNPQAQSHAGAQGIAQFIPTTAAAMGVVNPYDPEDALRGSARYWNQLRAYPFIGNDPRLIAAAYNAGPGAVQAAGGIPNIPETQHHVAKVLAAAPRYANMAGAPPAEATLTEPPTPPKPVASGGPRPEDLQAIVAKAESWSRILGAWYDMGGELFGGTITVRGHPAWNIGNRLLSYDALGPWEAYIEGVQHRYDVRTGQYLTTLRVTRGWYLSAAAAQALRRDGQTTVTQVTGGPPTSKGSGNA